jgi:epoxyqueuosine reductase QueG
MLTAELLKKKAMEWGADLVGIGSVERWNSAPIENDPRTIMPNAKSVICVGFRIHKGSHRGIEEGTYYSSYTLTGFADLNNIMAPILQRRVASLIEDYGYEATTVMYHANRFGGGEYNTGRPVYNEDGTPKPAPDILFNHRIAAVLCGVGEIGYSRLLLTEKFGPSQRVYFIITDAELEEDPIVKTKICDSCMKCVKECPAKALDAKNMDNVEVEDVTTIKRCSLDVTKCSIAHYGGISPFAPEEVVKYCENIVNGNDKYCEDGSIRPSKNEVVKYLEENVTYTKGAYDFTYGPAVVCAKCIRTCMYHLQQKNL